MAKRKRLSPANPDIFGAPDLTPVPGLAGQAAPIAQVAGEASAQAALSELAGAMEEARAQGLMIERLPLDAVDDGYLVRDRLVQDEEDLTALVESIRARGQQTPIEVIRLPDTGTDTGTNTGQGARYGLISGWRRLTALRRLHGDTGEDRFAEIRALVATPETAEAAYVAMVEENEIRVNLSFYERARIAVMAVREGVYPTLRAALRGLYGSTTRSKRSKIGSFTGIVEALDGVLEHPAAISEKLGLALAKALADRPGFADTLKSRLRAAPRRDAGDEIAILSAALRPTGAAALKPRGGAGEQIAPGIALRFAKAADRIELRGPGVDADLCAALTEWLRARA